MLDQLVADLDKARRHLAKAYTATSDATGTASFTGDAELFTAVKTAQDHTKTAWEAARKARQAMPKPHRPAH